MNCEPGSDLKCIRCGFQFAASDRLPIWRRCGLRAAVDVVRLPIPFCRHRGEPTGEVRICRVCGPDKGERREVYQCAVLGACTLRAWRVGQKEGKCDVCKHVES